MAYTKIKAVKNNLARCLRYTANPEKTERLSQSDLSRLLNYTQNQDKTEHQLYVAGFNCDPANAHAVMASTKHRWGKDGGSHVQGYHLIQSFKPGEVTPKQAFAIGCEFAWRYLADKYEVTVSAHLDRAHLHCHIVFNSVSFVDGRMFRNDFAAYYKGIRKISDELCRENRLSVIEPNAKGKTYNEWSAEQQGQPTMRSMIRTDVDAVLARSVSWETFVMGLRRQGYEVKYGANIKYAAIRHKSGKRWIRLKSLGEEYTEQAIREYFVQKEAPIFVQNGKSKTPRPYLPPAPYRRAHYRTRKRLPPKHKITGFMALYYRYLHLLGKTRQGHSTRKTYYLLREDFRKFARYQRQSCFIWQNHIETGSDLNHVKEKLQAEIQALCARRAALYKQRGNSANGLNKAELTAKIQEINTQLRTLHKEVSVCGDIKSDMENLQRKLAAAEQAERREREAQEQKHRKEYTPMNNGGEAADRTKARLYCIDKRHQMMYDNGRKVVLCMTTDVLTVRMDPELKKEFSSVCDDLGMTMTTAVTMLAKSMSRNYRLPEDLCSCDPFYSEKNMVRLKKAIADLDAGKGTVHEVNYD